MGGGVRQLNGVVYLGLFSYLPCVCYMYKKRKPLVLGMRIKDIEELESMGYVLMDDEEFSLENNILELLEERNVVPSAFADLIGTSRQSLNSILHQKTKPSVDFALRVAYALELPVESIFYIKKSSWVKQVKEYKDSAIFLHTKDLRIVGIREKNVEQGQHDAEHWNRETGEFLTKKEYNSLYKEYTEEHILEKQKAVLEKYQELTRNEVISTVSQEIKNEMEYNYPKLYKKIGIRFEPVRISELRS